MSLPIDSSYRRRKLWLQQAVFALFRVLSYAVVAVLFLILGFILSMAPASSTGHF